MPRKKLPVGFDENPEWTKADFARGLRTPRTKLKDLVKTVKRGRPPLEAPKLAIKLRLDQDIISAYRGTGDGWQTRINADLRKAAKKLKAG